MKTQKTITGLALIFLTLVLSLSLASAVTINSINQGKLYPGESGNVDIEIKNTLTQDVESVSLALDLSSVPFSSVGSSEKSVDDLNEDDTETFDFTIKTNPDIKTGDYNIPYVLTYTLTDIPSGINQSQSGIVVKRGTFGVTVSARTELDYSVSTTNPVIGQQGKLTLQIINRGLGDIKFVDVKITPNGYNLISNDGNYIGTVSSNDFETASFDVIFNSQNPILNAAVKFKDSDNKEFVQNVNLPFNVYTQEQAIQLGIIQKNNTGLYAGIVVAIALIYVLYKMLRKRSKKRKQQQGA